MADDCVRVAVRIRPLVQSERDRRCSVAVERVRGSPQISVKNHSDAFTFNYVYDESDKQELVYNEAVSEMLDKLFAGFNATILAYGQTGSGKTYTMGTADDCDGELNEHSGVIPRAIHDIFERIEKLSSDLEFVVTCSFMELYQEQLYDLLSSVPRDACLVDIRETRNGIVLPGLTEQLVHSAWETIKCLVRGSAGRAVASTLMNVQSSRSHAIFTVTIQATKKDELGTVTTSKFHLVDLAGSERVKKTQATGEQFKEAVKINQGLLALGNVISILGQGSGFVRYRESKLTRLLQDSLGGNSVTLMIACVSPADYNAAETICTLRYADRARKIKNKPIVNEDPHAAQIRHLKGIIRLLGTELTAAGCMNDSISSLLQDLGPMDQAFPLPQVQDQSYQQLQDKFCCLQEQLHEMAEYELRAHTLEAAHEKLQEKTMELEFLVNDLKRDFTMDANEETRNMCIKRVAQICQLMQGVNEELERAKCEISSAVGDDVENDGGSTANPQEVHDLLEQEDEQTCNQVNLTNELRRINREINLKEKLHECVAVNIEKLSSLDNNNEEQIKEYRQKIHALEQERAELLGKLRHTRKKSKDTIRLDEARSKRLQTLEQEISEMQHKLTEQSKLLKLREKENLKMCKLHAEILGMKDNKVKLMRAMRIESENFRRYKLKRSKVEMQLQSKINELQSELRRKETLHTKQCNVLKRKCEETSVLNKRLKDKVDRQSVAQMQRPKYQSARNASTAPAKIDQIISWADRKLDEFVSLSDAKNSRNQLLSERDTIRARIRELKQLDLSAPNSPAVEELAILEEDFELKSAQIAKLSRVSSGELDTHIRSISDCVGNVAEASVLLKHLLWKIAEMQHEHSNRSMDYKAAIEEQQELRKSAEARCKETHLRMKMMELEHEDALAARENTYEEQIEVILRELSKDAQHANGDTWTPEQMKCLKIYEEHLDKMGPMRRQLEVYRKMLNEFSLRETTDQPSKEDTVNDEDAEDIVAGNFSDNENFEDSIENEPYVAKPSFHSNHKKSSNASLRDRRSWSKLLLDSDEVHPTRTNDFVGNEISITKFGRQPKRGEGRVYREAEEISAEQEVNYGSTYLSTSGKPVIVDRKAAGDQAKEASSSKNTFTVDKNERRSKIPVPELSYRKPATKTPIAKSARSSNIELAVKKKIY